LEDPRTTIIIPNYNGARHFSALFGSIAAQSRPPARIILVDNGSTDNSRKLLPSSAEFLPLGSNHGFAHAVNRGVERATTDYVAILNNDVVLDSNWLYTLELALRENAYAYACPLLLSARTPERIDGSFDLLSRSGCAERAFHGESVHHSLAAATRVISFPPMTAALFRRNLFDSVGLLEESFGSYYEDIEFGLRSAARGFKGCYVPLARAYHLGSATLGAWSSHTTFLVSRNQLLLVARCYPKPLLRAWWWQILCGNILFVFLAMRHGRSLSAIHGKLIALHLWAQSGGHPSRESARQLTPPPADTEARLASVIGASERELFQLSHSTKPSRFWRLYFKLCPPCTSHPAGGSQ